MHSCLHLCTHAWWAARLSYKFCMPPWVPLLDHAPLATRAVTCMLARRNECMQPGRACSHADAWSPVYHAPASHCATPHYPHSLTPSSPDSQGLCRGHHRHSQGGELVPNTYFIQSLLGCQGSIRWLPVHGLFKPGAPPEPHWHCVRSLQQLLPHHVYCHRAGWQVRSEHSQRPCLAPPTHNPLPMGQSHQPYLPSAFLPGPQPPSCPAAVPSFSLTESNLASIETKNVSHGASRNDLMTLQPLPGLL